MQDISTTLFKLTFQFEPHWFTYVILKLQNNRKHRDKCLKLVALPKSSLSIVC